MKKKNLVVFDIDDKLNKASFNIFTLIKKTSIRHKY